MNRWTTADIEACLDPMRRYARVLTRDPLTADDLVQDALLRAYEKAESFRSGAPLTPWLLAILHNLHAEGRRRNGTAARALDTAAMIGEPPGDEVVIEQRALLRDVVSHAAALPADQQAVLHLIAVEGLSYQQAADTLGVPTGTVMSRLSRARARLRAVTMAAPSAGLRLIGGKDAV